MMRRRWERKNQWRKDISVIANCGGLIESEQELRQQAKREYLI